MPSKPWSAIVGGRYLHWSPRPPHLTGDDSLVPEVLAVLGRADTLTLSPVGPVVDSAPSEPLAVLAVVRGISPRGLVLSPDAPALPAAPVDIVF